MFFFFCFQFIANYHDTDRAVVHFKFEKITVFKNILSFLKIGTKAKTR